MADRRLRIRFAARFAVLGGSLLTVYSFPYRAHGIQEQAFAKFLAAYARVVAAILRLSDPQVYVLGSEVVGRIPLVVGKNCDAMDVNILFAAAILAFPARWSQRAIGIGLGVGLLFVMNLLRIISLYYIGVFYPGAFDVVHSEVWPLALVVLAVGAFVAWSRWTGAVSNAVR